MVDFARLNKVRRAIETDYDSWLGEEKPSAARTDKFLPAMIAILRMPVSPWNDPGCVSGEIDTERKTKMSYGNGYQGGYAEDHYGRMDNAKEIGERDPFIDEGPHRLCVLSIVEYMHQQKGPTVRITFEVLASQKHAVGSRVCKLYFLTKPSKFASQTTDSDRFADFVKKLKGITNPNHPVGKDCRTLLKERVNEQLARGMVIDAMGVNTSKNPQKPWVEVYWTSVEQTPETIGAHRRRVEGTPGLLPAAFAPAQQTQYAQQNQQQYAPPPPQQGYQNQYQQQPMPPAQPPAQPPAAPQGGFLSQVPGFAPPTGNNGGNTSGGW